MKKDNTMTSKPINALTTDNPLHCPKCDSTDVNTFHCCNACSHEFEITPPSPSKVEPVDLQKLAEEILSKLCIVDSDIATGSELKAIILTALQHVATSRDSVNKEKCVWKYDRHHAMATASCGGEYCITDEAGGNPAADNNFKFCPYCSLEIEEIKAALAAKGNQI